MKGLKRLFILIITILLVLPFTVNAAVVSTNLKETVEESGLEFKYPDYKETDDQVIIYLFRWNQCSHCHDFISFLNDIAEEYGSKFKLVAYEATTNADNNALWKEVSTFLDGQEATGYPYIVIGNKSYAGFGGTMDEEIKSLIDTMYAQPVEDRYDVMKKKDEKPNYDNIVMFGAVVVIGGIVGLTIYTRKHNTYEEDE